MYYITYNNMSLQHALHLSKKSDKIASILQLDNAIAFDDFIKSYKYPIIFNNNLPKILTKDTAITGTAQIVRDADEICPYVLVIELNNEPISIDSIISQLNTITVKIDNKIIFHNDFQLLCLIEQPRLIKNILYIELPYKYLSNYIDLYELHYSQFVCEVTITPIDNIIFFNSMSLITKGILYSKRHNKSEVSEHYIQQINNIPISSSIPKSWISFHEVNNLPVPDISPRIYKCDVFDYLRGISKGMFILGNLYSIEVFKIIINGYAEIWYDQQQLVVQCVQLNPMLYYLPFDCSCSKTFLDLSPRSYLKSLDFYCARDVEIVIECSPDKDNANIKLYSVDHNILTYDQGYGKLAYTNKIDV